MVLARQLIQKSSIQTSLAKAKAVQPMVEKLITSAKKGTMSAQREILKNISDSQSLQMLLSWVPTRFASRKSGFTRIIKIGTRLGDGTEKVALSFVDPAPVSTPSQAVKVTKPKEVKPKATKVKRRVKKSTK